MSDNDVPAPDTLMLIQIGGGIIALFPIIKINDFATIDPPIPSFLLAVSMVNILISSFIFIAIKTNFYKIRDKVSGLGQIYFCRAMIIYDMILLGGLVAFTGGPDVSVFTAQAAAVLPVALLVKDKRMMKAIYAAIFVIMYFLGVNKLGYFHGYYNEDRRSFWSAIFLLIFTVFPVAYSIQSENSRDSEQN